MKRTWTDEQLILAVETSSTFSEVIIKLGLVVGGSLPNIKSHIKRLRLDTSHFLNKPVTVEGKIKEAKTELELFSENGSVHDYKRVKRLILKNNLLPYKCDICAISSWQEQELVLQLDHKNGVKTDNRLNNLRLLCPNCHSQTYNFCGKNISNRNKETQLCMDCNKEISKGCLRCKKCSNRNKNRDKFHFWPELDKVIDLVKEYGFSGAGRVLGVSDNAIRKFIKRKQMGS